MFYANGTLTKYEVISMDVASANTVTQQVAANHHTNWPLYDSSTV